MDSQHLKELLQQYLDNRLSAAELQGLIDQLRKQDSDEALLSVIEEALRSGKFTGSTGKDQQDDIFQQILRKAGQEAISTEAEELLPVKKRGNWKVAVAALVLVVAGSAGYLLMQRGGAKHTPAAPVAKMMVLPGGNKAMLTLGDGRRIELDSAASGTLSQQGATSVTKLQNGQLAYQLNGQSGEVTYNTVSTPRGGQYQVVLPDGTKVWLNAASSLHFPTAFTGTERVVEVTGEAYFEVAQQDNQPFKVKVRGLEVKVLGTHFNVNAYTDEASINTTLLEGKVMVSHLGKNAVISPGQQAQVKEEITIVPHADIETLMAWKEGRFSYNNMELQSIMRQISRWYDVDVTFEDKITDTYSMEMSRNVPLAKLLQFMELSGGVHFVINERKIIVKK
ncbi:MAG: FecR domain-containing protein [Chitinophaga sp.]|uniref:FecR family protein n=1 Tax=Chitinophaga sp. TaxID=1869181 RepID=UPI001B0BBC04|nr:FecR family protein [Chitinophaga sp.]MBO9729647.1 FecR domain-containing protein [Chitinophaga sp.]